MIRKNISLLLLILASLTLLAACSEDDSTTNNDRPDFSTSGTDTSGATSGTDTSGGTSGQTDASTSGTDLDTSGGTTSGTDTSGGTTSGTDTSGGTTSGTDTSGGDTSGSTCTDACCPNTTFAGQVYQDVVPDPESTNGGTVSTTPYDAAYDANIDDVIAAAPAAAGATAIDIDIASATVTAVNFKPAAATGYQSFWIADGQEAIQVFLGATGARDNAPATIRVGQKVSFTATEVDLYRDFPQITNIDPTTWTVNSEDNMVYVNDIAATDTISLDNVQHLIRVTGTLVGTPEACPDPNLCYQLDYGAAAPVVLRIRNNFLGGSLIEGDCLTFSGPVNVFDGIPQLDATQFDWVWRNNQTPPAP
jgi:hypothetical protein